MKRYTIDVSIRENCYGEFVKLNDVITLLQKLVQRNTLDKEGVLLVIDELAETGKSYESNMGN